MEKLTIEELYHYLPYGLKIASKSLSGEILRIYEMELENDKGILNVLYGVNQIPILRPLSDYTGINSDAMNELNWDLHLQIQLSEMARQGGWWNYSALLIKECARAHIDFQDLIGQGKAININTIKQTA